MKLNAQQMRESTAIFHAIARAEIDTFDNARDAVNLLYADMASPVALEHALRRIEGYYIIKNAPVATVSELIL